MIGIIAGMEGFLTLWILLELGAPEWIRIIAIALAVFKMHYWER